jgi:cell division cycle protein 37
VSLKAQIACNQVLLPRIKEIADKLASPSDSTPATVYFNGLIDKLQNNPSRDCPSGNDPKKLEQTYDGMLLSLLKMVVEKAKERANEAGVLESEKDDRLEKELKAEMLVHVRQLGGTIEKDQNELDLELAEKNKKITTEDLHEGFESKVCRRLLLYIWSTELFLFSIYSKVYSTET